MQPPSSGTEARSKHMLTQRYGVHYVPKVFDTRVFLLPMDPVEGPSQSTTVNVADPSPSVKSRLYEGGRAEVLSAGLSHPKYRIFKDAIKFAA